ncbi:MAG: hypothetical protein IJZ33_07860 [Clostridia bacterium]|nr:hypothetical protein [Clostridia bacterium]
MGKKSNKQLKERRRALEAERRAQNKKQTLRVLLATICILLALTLVISGGVFAGMAIYNAVLDSGRPYRSIVSYKTEHYQINNAMLSFYFYDSLYDGLLERLDAEHPDELKSKFYTLTNQETGKEESVSYFNYYNELAAYDFQSDLLCAEAASDFGVSLDQRDLTFIQNRLKSIENSASSLGLKTGDYLSVTYGRGVKLSDVEDVLTITALADKLYAVFYAGQQITDSEIKTFLSENDLNFTKVDYYLHILTIPSNATAEEQAKLKEMAEKLTGCLTDEEFLAELKDQLTEMYGDSEDFDIEKEVESTILSEYVQPISEDTNELDRFLYDPATKQGQNYLSVGQRSYGVVRIKRAQYSSDLPLDTLRLIRLDYDNFPSKASALSAMTALKKELTGKSEQEFIAAVKKETHDEITAFYDGFYPLDDEQGTVEQLIGGKLSDAKVGDLIEFSDSQSLWLAYYCGKGITVSEAFAEESLRSERYTAQINGLAEKYEMSYSTSKINRIAPLLSPEEVG